MQAITPTDRDHLIGNHRMKVKMLVRVDVVERESGRTIGFELCLDFRSDLSARRRTHEYIESETYHIAAEVPSLIDKIRQAFRRQDRPAFHQHEVKADAQSRQTARALNCIRCRGCAYHEACGRQDAARVRGFDGLIDFGRKPEVVGRDDNMFQSAGSRRSRKNRKNSTPSRTISPAIAAIFGARK